MKDEAFLSKSFRQKCSAEVNEHCLGKKTKFVGKMIFVVVECKFLSRFRSAVVQCLADLMLQDVLKKKNSLTEDCRDELKFELLQRVEYILLFRINLFDCIKHLFRVKVSISIQH